MNQPRKAKGYVVEIFHVHQTSLDQHIHKTYEDALNAIGGDLSNGKIYEIHSKHSTGDKVDGFTYLLSDGKVASQLYKEEFDADAARTRFLYEHPDYKDPGKVIALLSVEE